jgi:hypothetical protein
MRCAPVIVLRASSNARQGIRQLEHIPDDTAGVVVVREHDGEVLYYVFDANSLRTRLSGVDPDTDIATALDLHEYQRTTAGQLDPAAPVGSVALEGRQVIGLIVDDSDGGLRGRGGTGGPAAAPPVTRGGGGIFGDTVLEEFGIPVGGRDITVRGGDLAAAEPAPPPPAGAPPPPRLFRAYPDVTAPGQVGAGQTFKLKVGFSKQPPPSMLVAGPPVAVIAGPNPEFIIQVTGFGFSFPNGIEKSLVVERDNPESDFVEFDVQADASEAAAPRILEVSYEFAGVVVGRSWAQVQVMPVAPAEPAAPAMGGGSGVITEITDAGAPHLSVDIFSQSGGSELRWRFHCRYPDIQRPGEVTTNLKDSNSSQSLAIQLMRQIPATQMGPALAATMRGVGDEVADALPDAFWPIFAETWRRARHDGEEPRIQITTTEPWIPWELAWIDKDRVADAEALSPNEFRDGGALGALWQTARWTTPTRRLVSGDIPAAPPASAIEADEMAVIYGNYQGIPGIAELPSAEEEGNTIAMAHRALPLSVKDSDVTSLLACALQRNGAPFEPTVIHFAGHGETDVNNPEFTGLMLAGTKLNPFMVRGFQLVAKRQPFVFLNACEAGVAGETLAQLGGLVGAFLAEGARGFIAPLWKVDDVEARDVAVEFYRRTLIDGETVSEAMRQIRRQFSNDSGSATTLAYVFYGNPNLRLERGAA